MRRGTRTEGFSMNFRGCVRVYDLVREREKESAREIIRQTTAISQLKAHHSLSPPWLLPLSLFFNILFCFIECFC